MRTTGTDFLKRAFDLMTLLGKEPQAQPLKHISRVAELPKPSAHRLLNMLKQLGYVATKDNGYYYLTSQVQNLVPSRQDDSLKTLALPIMDAVYAQLNETINLAYLDGQRIEYVHIMESTQPLRWSPLAVSHEEVLTTALGRAIYAYLPADVRESILPLLLDRVKGQGKYDDSFVRDLVKNTRRQKIAYDLEDNCEGAVCFGIPLLRNDRPMGAISVTVPTPRLETSFKRHVINVLKNVNNQFSDT